MKPPTSRHIRGFAWRRWWRQRRGATVVEYLVALILCVLVVLGISRLFGDTLYQKYMMGDQRISDMERSQRSMDRSATNSGDLVQASEIDDVNKGGRGSKSYTTRSRSSKLDGMVEGDSQLSQEEQKRMMAKRLASNSESAGGLAGQEGQRGQAEEEDDIKDPKMARQQYALRGEKPPEKFRFNPIILLIIAMLLLGLGYMMIKGNKDEG